MAFIKIACRKFFKVRFFSHSCSFSFRLCRFFFLFFFSIYFSNFSPYFSNGIVVRCKLFFYFFAYLPYTFKVLCFSSNSQFTFKWAQLFPSLAQFRSIDSCVSLILRFFFLWLLLFLSKSFLVCFHYSTQNYRFIFINIYHIRNGYVYLYIVCIHYWIKIERKHFESTIDLLQGITLGEY